MNAGRVTSYRFECTIHFPQLNFCDTPSRPHFVLDFRKLLLWLLFSCSVVSMTPGTAARQASLSLTISWSLLKRMSIESVMPSNHPILCHPLSSCPQSFPASGSFLMRQLVTSGDENIGVLASHQSFQVNNSGLVFFEIDCFDLLAVYGTFKSLLHPQSESISSLVLRLHYAPTLSHLYMIAGKTKALPIQTFVGKVIFCFFISPYFEMFL